MLEGAGLGVEASWLVGEEAAPEDEMLAFLRLKHMNGADAFLLEPVFMDTLWKEHLLLPVSKDNERAALSDAGALCTRLLQHLAGTVQDDLQVLAEAERDSREYALSALRYAERRALQAASRALETRRDGLDGLQYYQERRLSGPRRRMIETAPHPDPGPRPNQYPHATAELTLTLALALSRTLNRRFGPRPYRDGGGDRGASCGWRSGWRSPIRRRRLRVVRQGGPTVSSALSIGHHVRLWRTTQVVSAWRAIAAAYLALVIAGLQPEPRLESDELR